MPFSAGELCCSNTACVLLDVATGTTTTWERIPHVTQISFNRTANTPKLVTSSTKGEETSLCGTITQNGNLAIACHGGTAPGYLEVNDIYHIRWAADCADIWNEEDCPSQGSATSAFAATYFEAYIRITSFPVDMNISGNAALVYNYGFDIVSWVNRGVAQSAGVESGVTAGFAC